MTFAIHLVLATIALLFAFVMCLMYELSPDVMLGATGLAILYVLRVLIADFSDDIGRH